MFQTVLGPGDHGAELWEDHGDELWENKFGDPEIPRLSIVPSEAKSWEGRARV